MRRAALAMLVVAGCGGQAFGPSFREREQPEMSRVLEAMASAPARDDAPFVVAVTPDGSLIGWDLREGRRAWSVSAEPTATPVIAGRYVVATEPSGLSVRRLEDGERAFVLSGSDLRLVGADAEGDALVVSLARGEGESPEGVVIGAVGGAHRWTEELPLPVAVPAVAGSIAIVPWAHQRVSFLDVSEGRERSRLRLEDAVVGHALRHGPRVLLGQHELFMIDEQLVEAGRRGNRFVRPEGRPLPGQPPLLPDGYERRFAPDSARNRVRLAWALGEDGQSFTDGLLYFVFYRLVFALDAGADEARWVATLPSDAVGVAASPGGVMVVTEDGTARFLAAADGREGFRAPLGGPVRAAEIRLAGFAPALAPEGEAATLRAQLERAASLDDARLDGGRALAIRYLARSPEDDVTQSLISLCTPRGVAGPARRAACDALATRESGASFVRDALRGRASFLEGTPPPPVGALARAAANMRLRNVVPLLLGHLDSPATPAEELSGLLDGLGRLGDARAARPIEAFLRLYHADPTDAREAEAIGAAASALLALAPDRFATVQELASDPLAPQAARDRMSRALTEHQAAAAAPPPAPAQPPPRPTPTPEPVTDDRPERITSEIRHEVLRPVEARLRRCLEPHGADPFPSARVSMFIDEEGRPQTISVMPAALQECIEPLIRSRTFPLTRRGREALVHVIRR